MHTIALERWNFRSKDPLPPDASYRFRLNRPLAVIIRSLPPGSTILHIPWRAAADLSTGSPHGLARAGASCRGPGLDPASESFLTGRCRAADRQAAVAERLDITQTMRWRTWADSSIAAA